MEISKADSVRNFIQENDLSEYVKFIDDHDNAVIGLCQKFGKISVLYDTKKIIENLMENGQMTIEDAQEFFDFNIACAYVGEGTPVFNLEIPDFN